MMTLRVRRALRRRVVDRDRVDLVRVDLRALRARGAAAFTCWTGFVERLELREDLLLTLLDLLDVRRARAASCERRQRHHHSRRPCAAWSPPARANRCSSRRRSSARAAWTALGRFALTPRPVFGYRRRAALRSGDRRTNPGGTMRRLEIVASSLGDGAHAVGVRVVPEPRVGFVRDRRRRSSARAAGGITGGVVANNEDGGRRRARRRDRRRHHRWRGHRCAARTSHLRSSAGRAAVRRRRLCLRRLLRRPSRGDRAVAAADPTQSRSDARAGPRSGRPAVSALAALGPRPIGKPAA